MDDNTTHALNTVFEFFKQQYPQWVNNLFDEKFLRTTAAPLLVDYHAITPLDLANAWAGQIRWQDNHLRQRRLEELLPAATHFLQLLRLSDPRTVTVNANFHFQPFAFANR